VAAAFRQDWMYPYLRLPSSFPFAVRGVHLPRQTVIAALWVAELLAAGGLVAGLVAARRGARPPLRLLFIGACVAIGALAILPPAGSTDALDYAAFGRLLLLGHNPYVAPPIMLRLADPRFAHAVPHRWQFQVSLYGPAATFEQYLAARLGGNTPAKVVFWLKLWNAAAFGLVAIAADRVLRHDWSRRLRAHLLWTFNPLLIWGLVEAGHIDVLAAAAGVLGLLILGPERGTASPGLLRAAAAGALIGLAADIKINFLAFGIGLAWALRRSPAGFLAAAGGGLAVLAPTYAWFGPHAVKALLARQNEFTADSFYRLLDLNAYMNLLGLIAVALVVALAALLLLRMPMGYLDRPAIRPALAISVAWLAVWPYQLPWYDAMAICVLLFYPASRLDWVMIARLTAPTLANSPGNPAVPPGRALTDINQFNVHVAAPVTLLGCALALVALALSGRWGVCDQGELTPLPCCQAVRTYGRVGSWR
jgi:hypothetical protein